MNTVTHELNPLPPGFQARPVVMDDLEAAVELFNICGLAQIGYPEATLAQLRGEWELPDFDLQNATRAVFTADGRMVAYNEVWDMQQIPNRIWIWGRVHPDYLGRGIGGYLMDWAEARARQAIPRVPADARVSFQVGAPHNYQPAIRFFEKRGFQLARHFWNMHIALAAEPPPPQLPGGLIIRSMIPDKEERAVIWAARDAFKDHWGHTEQPFEEEYERRRHFMATDPDYDPTLWLVAMDGEEIAGVSLCRLKTAGEPDTGWINTLGVRRPWRRQGLGVALLQQSFRELYLRGQRRVGLGVDADSLTGATRLYEKAGMVVTRQFDTYEKELRPGQELSRQTV
jgi:mycothiol synthase